ncbi:hypothetical protein CC80DRAFT_478548 [Byssothecium circinans]|uniref:Rhodopsin domain-containing protein n=1 Tax=Byssothecium circinans TaxID=147558 RepID=A0A6A5TLN9_9PLEO|nr:hypothetical protein CC80DRAFT_478548 [Byssothecium circinans]
MELSMTKGVLTLIPLPEGYNVDFDNPRRNGDVTCYWLTGVGSFLALLFLGQRLYVKAVVRKHFRLDDYFLIVAWIFSIAIQILIVRAFITKYVGVHVWEMPFTKYQENLFYSVYVQTIIYAPPTALAKLVLLMFYLELRSQKSWFRWATYSTMFIMVGARTGIFFASIFACRLIAMGWDLTITDGICIDRIAMFEATAAFGVVVDCLIIAIPIPMVLALHMSQSKKIGLILMFVLGSITVITSIVRLVLLVTEIDQVDSTWVGGPINYWVTIEANLLIICASLPTCRQFAWTVAPGLFSTVQSSYVKNSRGDIATIGGGSSRNKHSRQRRTHDADIMMDTLVEGAGSPTHARDTEEGIRRHSLGGESDKADSQKGILKTQTTHVTYSRMG